MTHDSDKKESRQVVKIPSWGIKGDSTRKLTKFTSTVSILLD